MREKEASLVERFEITGLWWNPKLPKNKIPGRLVFDPHDGVAVELDGRLGGSRYEDHRTWPIILGETRSATPCLLVMVQERQTTIGPNTQSSRIFSEFCLLGCHLGKLVDIRFVSAVVDYSNLTAWMGRRPFAEGPDPSSGSDRSYSVSYHSPPDIRFSVPPQGFALKLGCWFSCGGASYHEVDMRFGESVVIHPRRKQSLRWYRDRLSELRNLLSLLMAEPVRFERIQLQYGSHLETRVGKMIKDYAVLLFRQPYHDSRIRVLSTFQIPFHFDSVRRHFPQILANWFERYDELEPVFDLFFLQVYNQHLNIEFQFLGLLQALEALHRRVVGGAYMSVDEYKPVRDHLVSSIPETVTTGHRAALKSRINYGYEYSLVKRLTEMSSLLSKTAMYVVTDGEDPLRFLGRAVGTRNYLTHYDENLKAAAMSPQDMMKANHSLGLFLMLLILREIQIPEDVSLARIKQSGLFRHPQFLDRDALP
jgi:hypothetical protein